MDLYFPGRETGYELSRERRRRGFPHGQIEKQNNCLKTFTNPTYQINMNFSQLQICENYTQIVRNQASAREETRHAGSVVVWYQKYNGKSWPCLTDF